MTATIRLISVSANRIALRIIHLPPFAFLIMVRELQPNSETSHCYPIHKSQSESANKRQILILFLFLFAGKHCNSDSTEEQQTYRKGGDCEQYAGRNNAVTGVGERNAAVGIGERQCAGV